MSALSHDEAVLLDRLQLGVPFAGRPFCEEALGLGLAESRALDLTVNLIERGLIRTISGIFNYTALGYRGTLVALAAEPAHIEEAAAVISAHPGVSHNYQRAHKYNLWFTLVLPGNEDLDAGAANLAREASGGEMLVLPAVTVYKLRTFFSACEEAASRPSSHMQAPSPIGPSVRGQDRPDFTGAERAAIGVLQEDMPIVERPFAKLGRRAGLTEDELLDCARRLMQRGVLRRYAAVAGHRRLGFSINVLVAAAVDEMRVDEVGSMLAGQADISHCLRRRPVPGWPYTLYAMLHMKAGCNWRGRLAGIAEKLDLRDYVALPTVREFKKERVRYRV